MGVVQSFNNGGVCSDGITPITSKLFFYCSQASTSLTQVTQPQTCEYDFTFFTPFVCIESDISTPDISSSPIESSGSESSNIESSPISSSSSSSLSSSPLELSSSSPLSSTGFFFDSPTGTDPVSLPSPPTNVQLGQSSTDGTTVIISWILPIPDDNTSIVGVIIYYNQTTNASEWVRYTYIGSRYTSTTVTNLNPSKAYHFCISCVNQYGEGQKSSPTPYLPGGRGADTETEKPVGVLTKFQIFGIVIGGITVLGAVILFGYIFFYRTKHKDEINTYQYMGDTAGSAGSGTTAWTAARSTPQNDKKGTGMALDDGTTLVASGGPVYGFENATSGKKKKSKKEGESDSDEEVEGGKKKKKNKRKTKSKKKNG